MERKKILFLPSWYPSRVEPANGNFIRRYAETISSFAEVNVLFSISETKAKHAEVTESLNGSVKETIIYYPKISASPLSGLFKLWRYMKMSSLGFRKIYGQTGQPDVVHVQVAFPAGLFALWLKWSKKIPFIVTEHWTGYYPEDGRYSGWLMKYFTRIIISNASGVTTVSSSLMNEMKRHGLKNNYTVIPNVVDTSLFKPSAARLPAEKKQFLHISNLDKQKNMGGILNAVLQLVKRRNDFQLLIVCDSKNKAKYEQLAAHRYLLNTTVIFTGEKKPDEVADMMNQSVALVMFSRFETMSIVMAEAWACGKPVITTRVGGVTEYMNDSRGRLVNSENEKELESTMNWMLDHFGEFDEEEIRKFAVENFSPHLIASKFEFLYKTVLS